MGEPQCPACRMGVGEQTHVHLRAVKAAPGDIGICLYCGATVVYARTGTRLPTPAEQAEYQKNPDYRKAQQVAAIVRVKLDLRPDKKSSH